MNLEEANKHVKACAEQMNSRYGSVVFDEWAIVSLRQHHARILSYAGPRNDQFLQNFAKDLGSLRASLVGEKLMPGDFEFARHGVGTDFESFMVLGSDLYLICNHTTRTTNVRASREERARRRALGLVALALTLGAGYVVAQRGAVSAVAVALAENPEVEDTSAQPTVAEIMAQIDEVASRHGVPPRLVAAVISGPARSSVAE